MASGSTAPFSGEFVDLENVPKLPEGISAEQILEQNADAIRQVAEARHAAGLSQVNADGGFFDAYIDSTKISSLNSTALNTGKGFVGCDTSGIAGNLVSSTTITAGQNSQSSRTFSVSNPDVVASKVEVNNAPGQNAAFDVLGPSGRISRFDVSTNTDEILLDGNTVQNSANLNQTYELKFLFSFSSNEFEAFIDGSSVGTFSFSGDVTSVRLFVETGFSSTGSVTYTDVSSKFSFATNGTVKHKQFTFTDTQGNAFSPSKVGVFPDQTLNGQSISYDLKDSSGSVVKTFNQSDLNQLQSVNTTDDTFQVEANLSGNGSQTPELEFLDVRGV